MEKSQRSLSHQSRHSQSSVSSYGKSSADKASVFSNANRVLPLPINIPTREHKSALIDDFEKGSVQKRITKQDYYEEIRKKPIKVLMTREISQYYGRETYLKTTIKEILIYIIFLLILSMLILETPSSDMRMFTSSMANIFTERTFSTLNTPLNTSLNELKYNDINTIDHIWAYLNEMVTTLETDLFFLGSTDASGSEKEELTASDLHENRLIGIPRIRTVRISNDSCTVAEPFNENYMNCFGYFSSAMEETAPFGKKSGTAWRYTSSDKTGMHAVYGTVSTYSGGGYYQDCPKSTNAELQKMLGSLRNGEWIDRATRAVIIDFTVYNANVNLFCIVKFLFELPPTGGVIPSFIIHTLRLIGYGDKNIILLGCTVLFMAFFVFYTIEELYEMTYFKWQFITSFWNFLDVAIVMMCYLVIATNLYQYVTANALLTGMDINDSVFLNFDQMLYVQIICNVSLSFLVFCCWIKILKYVGINHSMYQLQATLQLSFQDIIWYTVIFLSALFTFAFIGNILFGDQVEFYYKLRESLWTLLRAGVGDFNYARIEQRRPFLGPVYFFLILYSLSYIFIAMYLAILLNRYTEVRCKISTGSAQMKIGDVLQNWIVDIIGTFSHRFATRAREAFNRRKIRHKFQDVRYLLLRCGFTELEVNMFLAKYEISEDRVMTEEDLRNVMLSFQSQGTPQVGLAREIVRHSISEKLTALEEAMSNAQKKISSVMEILRIIETKISNR